MRQKKVKELRSYIRSRGWSISAEPYRQLEDGMILASPGRQQYQTAKREIK